VITRHKYKADPWNTSCQFRAHWNDFAEGWADRYVVLGFAVHFTSVTSNTPSFILI
jgi:hypothetical protein